MEPEPLFSPKEKSIVLQRTITLTIVQVADKLGLQPHHVNNCNRVLHKKIAGLTGVKDVTGMLVLGVAVASGEITQRDLQLLFASMGIQFNKRT